MSQLDDTYDDDAQAAEYVLRLLDATEHAAFDQRLRSDQGLQRRVFYWEQRLSPLTDAVPAVVPPQHVRTRLLQALEEPAASKGTRWRWGWIIGGALACAMLVFAVLGDVLWRGPDLSPAFQAELASADGGLVVSVAVIPATHEMVIERLMGAVPADRSHELWLIADGAAAPVSLGVLDADGSTRIRVPDEIAPGVRTGTIAVSLEPVGGAPDGQPTGAILATARFEDL